MIWTAGHLQHSLCVPCLRQARDLVTLGGEVVHFGAVGTHDRDLPLGSERRVRLKKTGRDVFNVFTVFQPDLNRKHSSFILL